MAKVELKNLTIKFGAFTAVKDVNLTINDGEFVVYLGPSGCGKTTTLRAVAGLQGTTTGDILFDGQRVNDLTASERNIAMVFQFVSLYPHLSIAENIVFPLKARGLKRAEIARKLEWVTEIFKLGDELKRYPGALAPGTTQKVALARAVVREPAVLLLDEPLSAIDEQFREEMRWELGHLQRELGVTTIYVTHDQREAMSLADRIVLMNDSRIVQVDKPHDLFFDPNSVFAGQFIGSPSMNFMDLNPVSGGYRLGNSDIILSDKAVPDVVRRSHNPVRMGLRPRDLQLVDEPPEVGIDVTVDDIFSVGRERYFSFRVGDDIAQGIDVRSDVAGQGHNIAIRPEGLVFFDGKSGDRIATLGAGA
ncbi:ABC transporter ATP-binding protein [Sedimentitalea sp.]|uniref:ABC transporter ATP-binding protein n=1 Tax=Sedimentitalea sp. TaxID=2048915 RepID=UPI0032969040